MTPEQFMERAGVERALNEQIKATGQVVTADTLRGCLMAATQMAHRLKLPEEDLNALMNEEWVLLGEYLKARKLLIDKKKGVK